MSNPSGSDDDGDTFLTMDDDPALAGLEPEEPGSNEPLAVTAETVAIAQDLAMLWLAPPDLEHAKETVAVIREMPGVRPSISTEYFLGAVAWLHGALTAGETDWGSRVLPEYLRKGGLPRHVVVALRMFHRERWMTDHWYSRVLDRAPDLIKIIACASRIAKLRSAQESATHNEWRELVYDTKHWVAPITFEMPPPWGTWLRRQFEELSAARRDPPETP